MDNNYTEPNQEKYEYSYQQSPQNVQYQQYQQYQQNPQQNEGDTATMTMGNWLVTLLVGAIPCVGVIMYFVWAFSKTVNLNKRNFCRAYLILAAIAMVLYIIFMVVFGVAMYTTGAGASFY